MIIRDNVTSGFGSEAARFIAKYSNMDIGQRILQGTYKIS